MDYQTSHALTKTILLIQTAPQRGNWTNSYVYVHAHSDVELKRFAHAEAYLNLITTAEIHLMKVLLSLWVL